MFIRDKQWNNLMERIANMEYDLSALKGAVFGYKETYIGSGTAGLEKEFSALLKHLGLTVQEIPAQSKGCKMVNLEKP